MCQMFVRFIFVCLSIKKVHKSILLVQDKESGRRGHADHGYMSHIICNLGQEKRSTLTFKLLGQTKMVWLVGTNKNYDILFEVTIVKSVPVFFRVTRKFDREKTENSRNAKALCLYSFNSSFPDWLSKRFVLVYPKKRKTFSTLNWTPMKL